MNLPPFLDFTPAYHRGGHRLITHSVRQGEKKAKKERTEEGARGESVKERGKILELKLNQ
jgi:hypothetical protein